jgi:hypothetical protein
MALSSFFVFSNLPRQLVQAIPAMIHAVFENRINGKRNGLQTLATTVQCMSIFVGGAKVAPARTTRFEPRLIAAPYRAAPGRRIVEACRRKKRCCVDGGYSFSLQFSRCRRFAL